MQNQILIDLLLVLPLLLLVFWISSVVLLARNYGNYIRTYNSLIHGEYVLDTTMESTGIHYFRKPGNKDIFTHDEILFFKDGSIKLLSKDSQNSYIHSSHFTYFDPYTLYWKRKITNTIEKIINAKKESL